MNEKNKKVRTSITIDPNLLDQARRIADIEDGEFKSVSQLIETALDEYVNREGPPSHE